MDAMIATWSSRSRHGTSRNRLRKSPWRKAAWAVYRLLDAVDLRDGPWKIHSRCGNAEGESGRRGRHGRRGAGDAEGARAARLPRFGARPARLRAQRRDEARVQGTGDHRPEAGPRLVRGRPDRPLLAGSDRLAGVRLP